MLMGAERPKADMNAAGAGGDSTLQAQVAALQFGGAFGGHGSEHGQARPPAGPLMSAQGQRFVGAHTGSLAI